MADFVDVRAGTVTSHRDATSPPPTCCSSEVKELRGLPYLPGSDGNFILDCKVVTFMSAMYAKNNAWRVLVGKLK
jgi:hypothetical protein